MIVAGRSMGDALRTPAEGRAVNEAEGPAVNEAEAPAVSEASRRAALTLHALPARDRRWVLQRLAPAERARVAGLLRELQVLGVPADRPLLEAALAGASPGGAADAAAATTGPARAAQRGGPSAVPRQADRPGDPGEATGAPADRPADRAGVPSGPVRELPLHEPAYIWAVWLLDRPAAQQARHLAALPASKAAAVRALMAGGLADAGALRAAVHRSLAEHEGPAAGAAWAAPAAGPWAGWAGRLLARLQGGRRALAGRRGRGRWWRVGRGEPA